MEHSHYISTDVLTLETLQEIISEHKTVALSEEAKINIQQCRDYLDQKMASNETPIYGINTGFGSLCNVKISNENLSQLQENLVKSHACGVSYSRNFSSCVRTFFPTCNGTMPANLNTCYYNWSVRRSVTGRNY